MIRTEEFALTITEVLVTIIENQTTMITILDCTDNEEVWKMLRPLKEINEKSIEKLNDLLRRIPE